MSKKILIVEDHSDIAKVLGLKLKQHGYSVAVAGDVITGVAQTHKWSPDLIILDLMLPAGGGLAFLTNIKSSMSTNMIPVIITTALMDNDYIDKINELGVEGFFMKPYDMDKIVANIEQLIGVVSKA